MDGRTLQTHQEWERVLQFLTTDQFADFIVSRGPMAARLSQSSPFAGVLTQEERRHIRSKLKAGRLKDYKFINAMLRLKLAQFDQVVQRIQTFPDPHQQAVLLPRFRISSDTMRSARSPSSN